MLNKEGGSRSKEQRGGSKYSGAFRIVFSEDRTIEKKLPAGPFEETMRYVLGVCSN